MACFRERDLDPALAQEVGFQLANVRISFDAENDSAARAGTGRSRWQNDDTLGMESKPPEIRLDKPRP
jgi:hypothetical protein